ncbi:hypothetical protein [Nocardia violaceofusca]|uniref:hypothetical protein n=1 Tax=Nocardia violaceofusca TaxID=941182 RepID=UPI000A8FB5EB|nr:hypothetical protein [Nocardia violaceofusca]
MIHDWSGSTLLAPWALSSVANGAFVQGARRGDDIVTGPGRQRLMNDEFARD